MYTHTVGFWLTEMHEKKKKRFKKITEMFAFIITTVNLMIKPNYNGLFIISLNHLSYSASEI